MQTIEHTLAIHLILMTVALGYFGYGLIRQVAHKWLYTALITASCSFGFALLISLIEPYTGSFDVSYAPRYTLLAWSSVVATVVITGLNLVILYRKR